MLFQLVGHILVVVLLVAQRPQQIKESRPGIFSLLAHGLDEFLAERLQEVAVADFGSVALEHLES